MQQMPIQQQALKKMKQEHGAKYVDKVTIDQLLGGARSIKCMLWETSLLDAQEGIRFRGYTIPELQEKLPTAISGGEPQPEAPWPRAAPLPARAARRHLAQASASARCACAR